MNNDTEKQILAQLAELRRTVDALAATPTNRRAIAEAQTRDRIRADLDEIDALAKAGPDERAMLILAMRPKRLQELRGMVSDKIEIARDLPIEARRKWLADLSSVEAYPIVAALHPADQLPDVVRVRARGDHKVEWKIHDQRGFTDEAYALAGASEFLDFQRDHFEALVSECTELRDALAANRLAAEQLNESDTRKWLAGQLGLGEFYAVQDYTVIAVEDDEDNNTSADRWHVDRRIDAGQAARDRVANAKPPETNPHEELREYHKRQREGDAERRIHEMKTAFRAAMEK